MAFDFLRRRRALSNERLERLIQELSKTDTPEARERFSRELLRSRLAIATPGLAASGLPLGTTVTRDEGTRVSFIATTGPDGGRAMVTFTSDEALQAWRPVGCDSIVADAPALFAMAAGNPEISTIVINPQGPRCGCYLTRREFTSLAEGRLPGAGSVETREVAESTRMAFGRPRSPLGPKLVDALRRHALRDAQIVAIGLVEIGFDEGPPRSIVWVELQPGADPDRIIPSLLGAVQPLVGEGSDLDFLPVVRGTTMAGQVREQGIILFERP